MDNYQADRTQTGPSWRDVETVVRETSRTHNCAITVDCCLLPDKAGRPNYGLWWRVVATWTQGPKKGGSWSKAAKWPHTDHKTVPGLLMKLAHDLDWALTMNEMEAEAQAFF